MKKYLYLLMMLISVPCFAGIGEDFDQLVEAYGKKYFELRERLLQNPEIKDYVRSLLQDDALPQLKKAQAFILLEWLDNKEAIREVLSASHIKPFRGRYPSWDSTSTAHARAREKLMTVYQENECPWFILECIWKFSGIDTNLVVKPFSNLPEYTKHNAEYIFFDIRKTISEETKIIFAEALDYRLVTETWENNSAVIDHLVSLGLSQSSDSVMVSLRGFDIEKRFRPSVYYLLQVTYKENLVQVSDFMHDFVLPGSFPSSEMFFSEFLESIDTGKPISKNWVKRFILIAEAEGRGEPEIWQHFIYRINPSMKGRIVRNEGPDGGIIILDAPKEPDQNNHENE